MSVGEDYIGKDISKDDAWLLELSRIPEELRIAEPELMRTRWFDYRHLLPAQATYLFAHHYVTQYRELYAKTRDIDGSYEVEPLFAQDVLQGPETISFWRARQAADAVGCTYEFYIRFVMNRAFERGWRYIPRPNQLYGDEIHQDAVAGWAEETAHVLHLAQHPMYRNAAYKGHPDQDAYHDYLLQQINNREHKHMILSRLMYRENCFPLELALKHFEACDIRRAKL